MVGLTKDDISTAMKAGTICTIGPGMSMFTVMVAFMNLIGAPYAWLRLSIIGTITTEMLGATAVPPPWAWSSEAPTMASSPSATLFGSLL